MQKLQEALHITFHDREAFERADRQRQRAYDRSQIRRDDADGKVLMAEAKRARRRERNLRREIA
jgi:alkyl sulfatase BDS1-like metallo-beta-lactamase superfamily hydrolase